MKTVAVIYGGKSSEHEVSLVSASSVVRNIDRSKFNIELIGITKEGRWYLQPSSELDLVLGDPKTTLKVNEDSDREVWVRPAGKSNCFITAKGSPNVDVVFPVVHGTFCEDGTLQGLLDTAEIPYVGCGCMASGITMDKEKTKVIWNDAGLPVVPYVLMTRTILNDSKKYDEVFKAAIDKL